MTFELIVTVGASAKDEKLFTLAIEVHASDGTLLKEGFASPLRPLRTKLPSQTRVHLMTRLPGGERVHKAVDVQTASTQVTVDILSDLGSPHEWLKWASSLRDLGHLLPDSSTRSAPATEVQNNTTRSAVGDVWALLWEFRGKEWAPSKLKPISLNKDRGIRQLEFFLPKRAHLLQIGGEGVSWRLVSLPSGGLARVAFTESQPGIEDSVQLTIGRETPGDEIVMAYLTRGALPEAARLEGLWRPAEKLLQGKYEDPIGAAAGAYALLRIGRLEERNDWAQRLVEVAPWMADGPIIAAALTLRLDPPDRNLARRRVGQALHRGLPVFGMGLDLLVETMTRLHRGKAEDRSFHQAFLAMQGYLQARASRHSYLSFFGETPTRPSALQLRGKADKPVPYRGPSSVESTTGVEPVRHTTLQVGSTKVTLAIPKSLAVSSAKRLSTYGQTSVALEGITLKGGSSRAIETMLNTGASSDTGSRKGRSQLVPSSGRHAGGHASQDRTDEVVRQATPNASSRSAPARKKRAALSLSIFDDAD